MKRMLTLVIVAALAAACGGDGGAGTTAPPDTTTTAPPDTTTTAPPDTTTTAPPDTTTTAPPETTTTTTEAPGPEIVAGEVNTIEFAPDDPSGTYLLYVPAGYDGTTPLPAVVALHGYTLSASSTINAFTLDLLDERGYAWIAPEATEKEGRRHQWAISPTEQQSIEQWLPNPPGGGDIVPYGDEDVLQVAAVLDDAATRIPIDPARVYAWGYSGGSWMSVRLACDLSDRFAAVGTGTNGVFFPEGCNAERAVSIVNFGLAEDQFHPAEWSRDGAHNWAEHHLCDMAETSMFEPIDGEFAVEQVRYANCRDQAEIVLYFLEAEIPGFWYNADMRAWAPRFDPPFDDPPALLLDFFEAHPMG
jgi:poly(3-hydroxybutyrate) depolymerase